MSAPAPGPVREQNPFLIVTGLSGSGKSLVHRCLEDLGYFCVDNLPIELIPKLAEIQERSGEALGLVALTVDVREREFLDEFPAVYAELRRQTPEVRLLFLEADDDTLVRRFSETRRPHPLSSGGLTLLEGIALERTRLEHLRGQADEVLDTSDLTSHELRAWLRNRYGPEAKDSLQVSVMSFAYRHGLPKQADVVLDVRFLPNPYFDDKLRPFSGRDEPVREFLRSRSEYKDFMAKLVELLDFLLPRYEREGKSYLTLAVGCTGGRHRSVAVAEELHERLQERGVRAIKVHRDCDRHDA